MLSDDQRGAMLARANEALDSLVSHDDLVGTDEEYLDGLARDLATDVKTLLKEVGELEGKTADAE